MVERVRRPNPAGGRPPRTTRAPARPASAVAAGAELVLVCGGDGTVAACAGALAGTGVAMAVMPAGTGNLLARNLGIPLELVDGARDRLRQHERQLDVLDAGDRGSW